MSFFGKLFSKPAVAKTSGFAATPASQTANGTPANGQASHVKEAARIKSVHVEDYCRRLEKEAERTGNARFAADAQRIRHRLRVSDLKP